jgi:hypothetical protein
MRGNLDKQSLIGILLVLVVLGLGGWMLLGQKDNGGVQKLNKADNQGAQSQLLSSALQSQLKSSGYASFQTISGKGQLSGGQTWAFVQNLPIQPAEAYDQAGNQVAPPAASLGAGGSLVLLGNVPQANLQDLLRQSLSDISLQVRTLNGKPVLVSSRLVAAPLILVPGKLVVDHLFLRSMCQDKAHMTEAALKSSCQATPAA